MTNNDWKSRLGVVFSTNPDYGYNSPNETPHEETLPPSKQKLIVAIDRRNRGGKQVTLVKGFIGTEEDLIQLSKMIKTKCGTGGTVKDGEVIIQGDFRDKILSFLESEGYKAKRGN